MSVKIRDTILIVDDSLSSRAALKSIFGDNYYILEAENGEQALIQLQQNKDTIAAVLLDIIMPVMDGYEVLVNMKEMELISKIPVIIITSIGSNKIETKALKLGASDIISKPYDHSVIRHRVQNTVDLYRYKWHLEDIVVEQSQKLRHSNEIMVDALASIIETRSLESGQHVLRIRNFTKILITEVAHTYPEYELDEESINSIASAAALHDIGKISIPDAILNKPGRLTPDEFEIMKTHSVAGCEMLEKLEGISDVSYLYYAYNICRYHHERWDGKGYPDGLEGEAIPLCAQVVGIADVYDALTTDRVYKPAFSHEKAINMIFNGECGAFSPKLLECLKNVHIDFANLAQRYVDGQSPREDFFDFWGNENEDEIETTGTELNPYHKLQIQFQSLLHHLNCAVLEVDLQTKEYKFVYNPYPELRPMESSMGQKGQEYILSGLHPDDRAVMLEFVDYCDNKLFDDHKIRFSRNCRVWNKEKEIYNLYNLQAIKVDFNNPGQKNIFVLWRLINDNEEIDASIRDMSWYEFSKTALSGLLGAVFYCKNDDEQTILEGEEDIAAVIGCSALEVKKLYNNSYISMVFPEDRDDCLDRTRLARSKNSEVHFEYRLLSKKGNIIWVRDRSKFIVDENGEEYVCVILEDITQERTLKQRYNDLYGRYQMLVRQTNNIFFEWNILQDTIYFSDNWAEVFGYKPILNDASVKFVSGNVIYPDDRSSFEKSIVSVMSGADDVQTCIRIKVKGEDNFKWSEIKAGSQKDPQGNTIKVVGTIIDIDMAKRAMNSEYEEAERDELTGFLNKEYGRTIMESYFARDLDHERSALLLVNLDNFKAVNEKYGYTFGDDILLQTADYIRTAFGEDNYISRIGGDEFMIFIGDSENKDLLTMRVESFINGYKRYFEKILPETNLSCSIGICFQQSKELNYKKLLSCADEALKVAKERGKARAIYFDDFINEKEESKPKEKNDIL